MRLFVAWYPGDPIYPQYDPDCALLISPTSVAGRWKMRHLPVQPQSLIVDSGGFRYSMSTEPPTQRAVFERQLRLIEGADCPVTLCQLDYPLINKHLTSNQRDDFIHRTLANAYEFRRLAERHRISPQIRLMGVVQGYDVDSIAYCTRELVQMGYDYIGIGSLALLFNAPEIIARIEAVRQNFQGDTHIFGVTGERIASDLRKRGIASIDSSRPAKSAMYNIIFSSNPFVRHHIRPTRGRMDRASHYIESAFPCPCPACNGEANANLLKVGKREYVFLRTLHNYYHLKQAICSTSPSAFQG
jgi:tRNA-guanine family transglycosylase